MKKELILDGCPPLELKIGKWTYVLPQPLTDVFIGRKWYNIKKFIKVIE